MCKETENYTDELAQIVHRAWQQESEQLRSGGNAKGGRDPNPHGTTDLNVVTPCGALAQGGETHETIPAMPLRSRAYSHRPGHGARRLQQAAVARSVPKKEVLSEPRAFAATKGEWDKLIAKAAWDMANPRAKADIIQSARDQGFKAHFGRLFMLCVEKLRVEGRA